MALDTALAGLADALERLQRAFENLSWAVVQGQPQAGTGHALVDRYEAATQDVLGALDEARVAAEHGHDVARERFDAAGARHALTTCQQRLTLAAHRYYDDLVAFEWIDGLNRVARERRGEWVGWVEGVRDALGRCAPPLQDANEAVLRCWQDLTEGIARCEGPRGTAAAAVSEQGSSAQRGLGMEADG